MRRRAVAAPIWGLFSDLDAVCAGGDRLRGRGAFRSRLRWHREVRAGALDCRYCVRGVLRLGVLARMARMTGCHADPVNELVTRVDWPDHCGLRCRRGDLDRLRRTRSDGSGSLDPRRSTVRRQHWFGAGCQWANCSVARQEQPAGRRGRYTG